MRGFDRRLGVAAIAIVVGVFVLGCGGGGSTAPSADASAAASSATGDASSEPAASAEPGASAAASAGGGATGSGVACDLITADEAVGLTGAASVTTDNLGEPKACIYTGPDSQTPLLRLSLITDSVDILYDGYAADSSAVPVAGLGDGAVWVPNQSSMFVKKGGVLLQIAPGDGSDQDLATAAAQIAVDRM